jgi:hypothetical protein
MQEIPVPKEVSEAAAQGERKKLIKELGEQLNKESLGSYNWRECFKPGRYSTTEFGKRLGKSIKVCLKEENPEKQKILLGLIQNRMYEGLEEARINIKEVKKEDPENKTRLVMADTLLKELGAESYVPEEKK